MIYIYCWRNNSKRLEMYGRECRVIVRGSANSALVEFKDGQREVVSRNALKRASCSPEGSRWAQQIVGVV